MRSKQITPIQCCCCAPSISVAIIFFCLVLYIILILKDTTYMRPHKQEYRILPNKNARTCSIVAHCFVWTKLSLSSLSEHRDCTSFSAKLAVRCTTRERTEVHEAMELLHQLKTKNLGLGSLQPRFATRQLSYLSKSFSRYWPALDAELCSGEN